ncbi:MAG: hypothetical protein ACYS21_10170, partial [Planctomycetota bacterium]
ARSDHAHDGRYYTEAELQTSGLANVNWGNLTSVPAGFADGIDNVGSGGPDSDWMVSGNNIYSIPTGKVGIGTISPMWKLDVVGDLRVSGSSSTDVYGQYGVVKVSDTGTFVAVDAETSGSQAVRGRATATGAGTNYGGYFEAYKAEGRGVAGVTNGISGQGVYGEASGSSGQGVYGEASGSSGRGVRGVASGSSGQGVQGYASNPGDVTNYGGYFQAQGQQGHGVYGEASGISGRGVRGVASGSSGQGVQGYASNSGNITNYGGYFVALGDQGRGIYADGGSNGYAAEFRGNVLIRNGSTGATVMELGEGLDYAEGFDVAGKEEIGPGSVLIIDTDNPGKLALSAKAYDSKVAGIVAGAKSMGSGVRLGAGEFDYDVALAGRVYCNVDATETSVEPGDLLTTSATAGYAMKTTDYMRAQGAILGKAMEKLEKGRKGQILVLVTVE